MEKNLNTFCMRLKESYGWHFPELGKLVADNEMFTKLVRFIGNRETLKEKSFEDLLTIVNSDDQLVAQIIDRSKSSMGNDLSEVDEKSLMEFSDYILKHFEYRREL